LLEVHAAQMAGAVLMATLFWLWTMTPNRRPMVILVIAGIESVVAILAAAYLVFRGLM
jgi:hypothetical protein